MLVKHIMSTLNYFDMHVWFACIIHYVIHVVAQYLNWGTCDAHWNVTQLGSYNCFDGNDPLS